jgi:hypothetical protein
MTVVAVIVVLICMAFVPSCSSGEKPTRPMSSQTPVISPTIQPKSDTTEEVGSGLLRVELFSLTKVSLRLDYVVHNPFDHDLWVCEDLHIRSRGKLSERNVETRITDGSLRIRLHGNLEWNFFTDPPIVASYRRLPSGKSASETLLLSLPITNNSPVYAFDHRNDVRAVAHRVVFELGYFMEDLPALFSEDGRYPLHWVQQPIDPNVTFIPHQWQGMNLEHVVQVTIADVNVPVVAHQGKEAS